MLVVIEPRYKLAIQMVPQRLWKKNLRHLAGKYQWNLFRKSQLAETGLSCSICGFQAEKSRDIFLHEDWQYDETTNPCTVRLIGFATACWNCHSTEHWGLTERMEASGEFPAGTKARLMQHWAKVNNASKVEFEAHREAAFDRFERLSAVFEWQWDWGPVQDWIDENFGSEDPFRDWPLFY